MIVVTDIFGVVGFFRVLIFLAFVSMTAENIWASEDSLSEPEKMIYSRHALILAPSKDSNDGWVFGINNYKMTFKSLRYYNYSVEFKSAKNFEEAKKIMKAYPKHSIDILLVSGHGSSLDVHFGPSILTENEIEEKSFELLKKTGIIVLGACETGASEAYIKCIAERFSTKLGVTVFAPAANITSLWFVKTSEGVLPVFSLHGVVVPARSFKNGRVQYSDCMNDEHRKIAFNGCKLFDFVQFGHLVEAMSFLEKRKFSADYLSVVLFKAASRGHLELSKALIYANADLGETTEGGYFALRSAACEGHTSVVKMLLGAGANVNQGTGGVTAIDAAAYRGHTEVVSILIEAKASLGLIKDDCWSALKKAASASMRHARVLKLLINAGAEVDLAVLKAAFKNWHPEAVEILNKAQNKRNGVCCQIL